jgi:hypothetical protein
MTKYILIMKICSALHGECMPEYNAGEHATWYDCAAVGTMMTANALSEMGPDLVNQNKIYVTFKCKPMIGA